MISPTTTSHTQQPPMTTHQAKRHPSVSLSPHKRHKVLPAIPMATSATRRGPISPEANLAIAEWRALRAESAVRFLQWENEERLSNINKAQ